MSMDVSREHVAPRWLAVTVAALGLLLSGCPETGADCGEGLTSCFDTCQDTRSATLHCGACGAACGRGQVCVEGNCECRDGAITCGGQCVTTASDPLNCGSCGIACGPGNVCEAGQCRVNCSEGATRCGNACVNLMTSASNCGACGNACGDAKSCHDGVCTYDIVAACFNTGQVVGLQAGADIKGPNVAIGELPQSVARMQDVLLVLDAAKRVREAKLVDYAALPGAPATGDAPNQMLVDDPYVYVINSLSNTLLVFRRQAEPGTLTDGTRFPQGLQLQPVASVDFGANTNPFAMAKLGTDLWVSLYGNLGGDTSAGGKVARVNLANPLEPALSIPFIQLPTGEELRPFPGSSPIPSPSGIVAHGGKLYTALNNLDPNVFSPGGPGLVARIDPQSREVRYLSLGDDCLNPGWLAPVGDKLLVSCSGRVVYDGTFTRVVAVEKGGLVLLDAQDAVVATYPLACPEGSGDTCPPPSISRFTVVGNRAYLGDSTAGRVFVVEVSGNQLIERRGLGTGSQPPILACQRSSGFSLVGDIVAIP
ncbi:MXAN_6577-like cysteine-rich protein [Hyalangium rubrum]|uniref:MXAN_6577-like cysteine-rich protein n=1 Tax=Hyalangium rubrum TaxID=3103134 RepID=A0ABU5H445_9BACT|nr:MXAN_6577-like cysteine-rich protein [Hyalangium sp. s54d21]MDY7227562.1 MXAN_6577-like cysteine-rich protein [Hyalangium sp. s54d21]